MNLKQHIVFWNDTKKIIYYLAVFYSLGIIGHLIPVTHKLFLFITPISLLLFNIIVLLNLFPHFQKKHFIFCIITLCFTFIIEVIGVKTKLVFGDYMYGKTLGIRLFDVPPIIALNWLITILGAISFVETVFKRRFLILILVPVFSVLFDIIMEPAAIKFDYWVWAQISVPFQNYIAWAIISFLISLFYYMMDIRINSIVPAVHMAYQSVFFLALLLFV